MFSHKFLDIAAPTILVSIFTLFTYSLLSTVASTNQLKNFEKSLDNLDINIKERFDRVDEDIKSLKEDMKSFKNEIKEEIGVFFLYQDLKQQDLKQKNKNVKKS